MQRPGWVLVGLIPFAVLNSIFALLRLTASTPALLAQQGTLGSLPNSSSSPPVVMIGTFLSVHSLVLAPASWLAVVGVLIWHGRVKARWEALGFDSEVFGLFIKMKGGKTRWRMLNALIRPKDRYQLAQELNVSWRAIDQHLVVLTRHGLVGDDVVYGKVRMYHLTPSGKLLLQLLDEIDAETTAAPPVGQMN